MESMKNKISFQSVCRAGNAVGSQGRDINIVNFILPLFFKRKQSFGFALKGLHFPNSQ